MIRALALLALSALATPASAAQPDWCRYSGLSTTERTICATPALHWRDTVLNSLWEQSNEGQGVRVPQRDWLGARDACGRDVECIAESYDTRIVNLQSLLSAPRRGPTVGTPPPAQTQRLRPWCGARLNRTEATICDSAYLADLDETLQITYDRLGRNAPDQSGWLNRRNRCGGDFSCIEQSYRERIRTLRGLSLDR